VRSLFVRTSVVMLLVACESDRELQATDASSAATVEAGARDLPASPTLDAGLALDAQIEGAEQPSDESLANGLRITDAAIAAILALDAAVPRDQTARCGAPAASNGVGLACTPQGRECPSGLTCTARFRGDAGICTMLGCGGRPDACGSGASCCTLLQAGGVSLCFPNACLPTTCLEAFQ